MFPEKLLPAERRLHQTGQRMADVSCFHSGRAEELLLKRKNAQQAGDGAAQGFHAAFPPRPGLRRHQINHRNALGRQAARHAQVKIGGIGENRQIRLFRARGGNQPPVFAPDARQVAHHFEQADHRQAGRIHHRAYTFGAKPRPGAAEALQAGRGPAQLGDHQRGVEIARGFARRYEDFSRHRSKFTPPCCYNRFGPWQPKQNGSKLTVDDLAARFRGEMIPLTQQVFLFFHVARRRRRAEAVPELTRSPPFRLPWWRCCRKWASSWRRISSAATARRATPFASSVPPKAAICRIAGATWINSPCLRSASRTATSPNTITGSITRWRPLPPTAGARKCRSASSARIREELSAEVHGEVDEKGWHLKQALVRRQTNVRKETKLFRDYARQAFEDTLTLYLHGTCCDIDVETGPRQMPSRYLRRRLELLVSLFPPPEGYAVLPEQLKGR